MYTNKFQEAEDAIDAAHSLLIRADNEKAERAFMTLYRKEQWAAEDRREAERRDRAADERIREELRRLDIERRDAIGERMYRDLAPEKVCDGRFADGPRRERLRRET